MQPSTSDQGLGQLRVEESADEAVVDVVEPPDRLVFRWRPAGVDRPYTTVSFTSGSTGHQVTLVESWSRLPDQIRVQSQQGNDAGWRDELEELKTLPGGRVKDPAGAVFAALSVRPGAGSSTSCPRHRLLTATELAAKRIPVTRQAIAKHFISLEEAELAVGVRVGRETRYELRTDAFAEAEAWM